MSHSPQSPSLVRFLQTPVSRSVVLVKTIVLSVAVLPEDEELVGIYTGITQLAVFFLKTCLLHSSPSSTHLIFCTTCSLCSSLQLSNLHELRALCVNGDVFVLGETGLETEASLSSQDHSSLPSHSPQTFHTNLTAPRTFYFFATQ